MICTGVVAVEVVEEGGRGPCGCGPVGPPLACMRCLNE